MEEKLGENCKEGGITHPHDNQPSAETINFVNEVDYVGAACTEDKTVKKTHGIDSAGDVDIAGDNSNLFDDVFEQGNNAISFKAQLIKRADSMSLFHEKYDDLDETDAPLSDPSISPECTDSPKFEGLTPDSLHFNLGTSETDFPATKRSDRKPKVLTRLKLEDDEGITSIHSTFFPSKKKQVDSANIYMKLNVNSNHYYEMSSFPRGTLTILNVEYFRKSSGMSEYPRTGTDRDADGLCSLFLDLGFIVERYDNPTKKIMISALEIAASNIKSNCCVIAALTHGEEGIIFGTDGSMEIKEIMKIFHQGKIAGKPKIFIFQACQGSDYMDSVDVTDVAPEKPNRLTIPSEADFFYAYSTVPGYFSWRNSRQGSWFIQAICSVFRQYAHSMDLYRMLIRVNDLISGRKSETDDKLSNSKRQIASLVSQLRKELFFFPPYGPLPLIKIYEKI